MMTCGSDRSGIASSGIFRIDQTPIGVSTMVMVTTMPLCAAQYSMMALIMLISP